MIWTREVFTGSRKYTSDHGYLIIYRRVLSARPAYTLYLNDANGTYIATFYHLGFAKKNADRHQATGRLIGHNAAA